MPEGQDWSREEVEACVADYLRMLTLELNGQRYSKAEHARRLLAQLAGRSRASVEFKHCNISAVLLALDYPCIKGYKPRSNVQALLIDVVEGQLQNAPALQEAAQAAVLRPAVLAMSEWPASVWVPPPRVQRVAEVQSVYAPRFVAARRDYIAQESRNRSLGRAGELFVAELEARRLHAAGQPGLADRVEHVSATRGDGLGYDVLSFDVGGRERLIEVKTTAFGELTPFYVSRNEVARSEADAAHFHLYRLFDFRDRPRLFDLPGSIRSRCDLEAVTFLARIA